MKEPREDARGKSVPPKVLVAVEEILPVSQTFIKAQSESIKTFDVKFAALYKLDSQLVPRAETAFLVPSLSWLSMKRVGLYHKIPIAPLFHARIARWRPSIVNAHFATDALTFLPLVERLKVPLVVTLHGYDVCVERDYRRDYSQLWDRTAVFLCVSEFLRRRAIAAGFPPGKLRTHYIGVDTDRFPLRNPGEEVPGRVLFVGRLVEKKGCGLLIQAMQIVQRSSPAAHLIIIGDGPLRGPLEQQARELNLNCQFLGAHDSATVREHICKAAVFCVPSVTARNGDSETFGIVFIEAQSMGVPVVSFDHGGIGEAAGPGSGGLLAEEGDVAGLAERILALLSDGQLRSRLGRRGAEFVRQRFELSKQTALLEGIYRELLAK